MFTFHLSTMREGMVDITEQAAEAVRQSAVQQGICIVSSPHTTAGITINENADPDVVRDILFALNNTFPDRPDYRHAEGNTTAHLKASFMGSSATIPVEGGRLVLGTWQGIYFCEFDGPRRRDFHVAVLGGAF